MLAERTVSRNTLLRNSQKLFDGRSLGAADTRANLGILIIPSHARSSHTAALGTPGVHVLATLKKGFRFIPEDAWKGEEDLTPGNQVPRWTSS